MNVWVNGCFDVVHSGHLYLLTMAGSLGDVYVGIDSDARIKASKGEERPIFPQVERALLMSSIKGVKDVFIFHSDDELEALVMHVSPDFMLVGEEYKGKRVIGSQFAKDVIYVPKVDTFSTTNIVAKIQSLKSSK